MDIKDRNVDFVFCIDMNSSTKDYYEKIKKNFSDPMNMMRIVDLFYERHINIIDLRFKFILFNNDYIIESKFFDRISSNKSISEFLDEHEPSGSGISNNGLEALTCALRSDFTRGRFDRQFVILFSDSATSIEEQKIDEFVTFYNEGFPMLRGKRMFLVAPCDSLYGELETRLYENHVLLLGVKEGKGLKDFDDEYLLLQKCTDC